MKRLENRAEIHEKKHMEKGNQLRLVPTLEVVNLSICFYFKNFEGLFTLLDSVSKPAWFIVMWVYLINKLTINVISNGFLMVRLTSRVYLGRRSVQQLDEEL